MTYPNLLEILRASTVYELQVRQLKECNWVVEANRRWLENQAAGEGTSNARDVQEELLGATIGTLRG